MAFAENRFVRQTSAYNAGQITTTFNPESGAVIENGPAWFTYASATDALATIVAANYFADVVYMLSVNDRIDITGSDASGIYIVATVDRDLGTITLVSYSAAAVVGTADIQDDAVTTAKIADDAVTTAKIADGAVTAAKIGDLEITNTDVSASAAIAFSKLAALPSAELLIGSAGNVATAVAVTGDIAITNGGVTSITAGAIVNADVSGSAAIDYSKLAPLASANMLVGSGANVATSVAITGDVTISNAGVTAIAADSIVNADVNSAAAIAYSKLAALPSAEILVGSAGNVATAVAMSGDVAIANTGATTIQAGAVDKAMLAATVRPSHMIVFAGQETTVGGAAAEAFTVTGAVGATDTAFVQMVDQGTGVVTALIAVVTNDTLTVTFSADPQNDAIFNYQIIRATS
jgi:hypothetical protein